MSRKWLTAAILLAIVSAAAFGGYRVLRQIQLQGLAARTIADLVYIEGGTFRAGNYQTGYRLADGTVETRWVIEPQSALDPHDVTLAGYYLQAHEATNADFNLYLAAHGRGAVKSNADYDLGLPDKAAPLAVHEAEAYCAWLGALTGTPLRLPTEAEWEFAARSRIFSPPWPTNDGEYRKGVNVPPTGYDDPGRNPPVGRYPPNPLGIHGMAEGLYEWVSDTAPTDPPGVRIAKGSSNFSTTLRETIPGRYVVAGTSTLSASFPQADRMTHDAPKLIHFARATARCVAEDARPPSQSGFGQMPDLGAIELPDAYGPYDSDGNLLR